MGGGLHWGVGKLTRSTGHPHKQETQPSKQLWTGCQYRGYCWWLIEDAEDAASVRSDAETMVVYDSEGNGRVVDVVNSDVEGQITIQR